MAAAAGPSWRELLERADSVLEPEAIEAVRLANRDNEAPANVIKMLADNYQGYSQMANLAQEWLVLLGDEEETVEDIVRDKLKEMVFNNFDAKLSDGLLDKGAPATKFLEEMIQRHQWRQVIYTLSEKHPQSLFLKYAIQCITRSEFKKEIASVASAASSFTLFSEVFMESVVGLTESSGNFDPMKLTDFKKMCMKSEYTFLYSLWLLRSLSASIPTHTTILEKLCDELDRACVDRDTIGKRCIFMSQDCENFSDVLMPLAELCKVGKLNLRDVSKIQSHLAHNSPADRVSPNVLLSSTFLDALFSNLFNAQILSEISSDLRVRATQILSVLSLGENAESLFTTDEFRATFDSLSSLQMIIMESLEAASLHVHLDSIQTNTQRVVYACAIVWWLRSKMCDPLFYLSSLSENTTPLYIALLQHVAFRHTSLRKLCVSLLFDVLSLPVELDPMKTTKLRKSILDAILFLIFIGTSLPLVFDPIKRWAVVSDPSLVAYFITSLLSEVRGPYSSEFVCLSLEIISLSDRILAATLQLPASRTSINNFIGQIKETDIGAAHGPMFATLKSTLQKFSK